MPMTKEITRVNPTLEELKEVYENPTPLTEEEIKNIFIIDNEEIDLSELKIHKDT